MSVCCLSCVVVWFVGFVSWQRVSVACFPPNNTIKKGSVESRPTRLPNLLTRYARRATFQKSAEEVASHQNSALVNLVFTSNEMRRVPLELLLAAAATSAYTPLPSLPLRPLQLQPRTDAKSSPPLRASTVGLSAARPSLYEQYKASQNGVDERRDEQYKNGVDERRDEDTTRDSEEQVAAGSTWFQAASPDWAPAAALAAEPTPAVPALAVPEKVRKAFEMFDEDTSGGIDRYELKKALRQLGIGADSVQAQVVLQKYDSAGTGKLGVEQFSKLVQELIAFQGSSEDPSLRLAGTTAAEEAAFFDYWSRQQEASHRGSGARPDSWLKLAS